MTRPTQRLAVGRIETAFRCCADRFDVINHLRKPFDATSCAVTAVRLCSQDPVAKCLPVETIATRGRRRTRIVALLLGTEDDEPFTFAGNPRRSE
jgi:hypothetical protein